MLKFLRTFALAAAMMLPFAMQAQQSWTVADGTTTHALVPLDFYNCDGSGNRQAQMLYPASLLTEMDGATIGTVKLYHQNTGSKTVTASTWYLRMGETSEADLSSGFSSETLTTVYSGNLVITGGVMTFELTTPYTYNGGNLIVEIQTSGASGNWFGSDSQGCYGVDNAGSTYSTMSSPNYTAFVPKATFTEAPSCFPVTGLAIDATQTTSSSLTLTWTDANNSGASYDIYMVTPTDTTLLDNTTTTTYTATGLNANTAYVFGVVSNCSGGDMAQMATVSGRTACGAAVTGTTWNFEDMSTSAAPMCFTHLGNGSSNVTTGTSNTNYHSATKYIQFSGATGNNILILPETEDDINTLQLKFWTRPESSSSSCGSFSVGYITDITDASTFTALTTYSYSDFGSTVAYTEKTVMFDAAPAGSRMAFCHNSGASYYYWYLDDVTIEELPSCIPVSSLAIDANETTSNSITLTWMSDATDFVIYNMADGSTLGTSNTNSFTATGLDANTNYTFGVAVACGSEESDTVTVNGRTACAAIATLPYTMGFEQGDLQGATNALLFPFCWTRINTSTSTSYNYFPYAYNSSYNAHGGSNSLYFYASSSYGTYADTTGFVMPALDVETYPMNGNRVVFWAKVSSSSSPYTVLVGTMTDPSDRSTFTLVESVSVSSTSYTKYTVSLASANGTDAHVAFIVPQVTSTMYIDDVTLEELPSCGDIASVQIASTSTESITLSWTAVAGANGYTIYDMADNSVLGTATDTIYTVTGLDANTAYTFGVQSNCAGGDGLIATVSGRTACAPFSAPYTWNFEDMSTGAAPICWSKLTGGSANVTNGSNDTYYHSASNYLQFSGVAGNNVIVLPETEDEISTLQLRFWTRPENTTNSSCGTFSVGYMTDAADATTFVAVETYTYSDFTAYEEKTITFATAPAGARIAMRHDATSTSWYWRVDDVTIEEAPACLPVTGLAVSNITSTGATLTWSGDADGYTIYDMRDTTVYEYATETTVELYALDPVTAYTFGVAANCGGEESDTMLISFRTLCGAVELPYTETFAAASATRDCWNLVSNNTANVGGSDGMGFVTVGGRDVMRFSSYSRDNAGNYDQYGFSPLLNVSEDATNLQVKVIYGTYGSSDQLFFGYVTANDTVWDPTPYTTNGGSSASDWQSQTFVIPATATQLAVHYYGNYQYYAWVDSVVVTELTADYCFPVSDLTVDAAQTTTESITLNWVSDGSSFTVLDMADSSIIGTTTDTFMVINNLEASSRYTFGVVNNCGSGDSDTVTVEARTACAAFALPYTEDFENGIDCWSLESCASGTNVVEGTSYAYTGTHAFKFAYNTNPPQYLISPELTGGENGVQVSLMYKVGGSFTESFVLGYSTTTNETSAFTWLTEQTGLTNTTYEAYTDYMPAGTKYVAVKYTANNQLSLYIDSLVFSPMSANFCFPVTGLAVDTATGNSVTISWTGDAASYDVYNGTALVGSTTDTFYTVSGLTASTAYTFGVQAICSASDSSDMVTIAAMTDCEGGSCTITIVGTDEYGDGWDNSYIDIQQNGASVGQCTVEGDPWAYDDPYPVTETYTYTVCAGVPVTFTWVNGGGNYDDEASFIIKNGNDSVIYTASDASELTAGSVFYTANNVCGSDEPQPHPQVEEATIDASAVTYWVGTGNNQVVMAINWADTALAWGVNFSTDSITSQAALDTIAANDPRFSWDTGSYGLGNITFTENGTTHTGDATHFWESKRNTISDMGLYQNLGNGDFQKWANSAAGVVVDSMEYSGVWYYMYNYPMTIYPVTAPQPGPQPADSIVVTFATNDATLGTTTPAPGTYTYHDGDTIRFSATATTGNSFVEWIIDYGNGTTDTLDAQYYAAAFAASTMIGYGITNMTMTANFQAGVPAPDSISVTYTVNDAVMGTITPNGTIRQAVGDSLIATATANDGYRIHGWRLTIMVGEQVASDTTFVTATTSASFGTIPQNFATAGASVIVTAVFEAGAPDSVEVTYTVNDATMGSINPSGTVMTAVGTQISATATANAGYELYAWVFTVMLDDQVVDSDTIMTNETSHVFGSLPQTFADYNATVIITALFQQQVGIEDADIDNVNVYSANSTIYVRGAEGKSVYVFDVNGRMLNHEAKASENCDFRMENTGVYLVKVGNAAAQRVLVVR